MGIFTNYLKVGHTGSPEKFLKVFKKLEYSDDARSLTEGALKAFGEGRPENLQILVANRDQLWRFSHLYLVLGALSKLPSVYGDALTDLNMAITKMPEGEKNAFLKSTLNIALREHIGGEDFYALLLKAGVDANAPVYGHPAALLVTATCNRQSINVIKLLHDNGASFDDALTTMHCQNKSISDIERLQFFQQKIEGTPPKQEAAKTPETDLQSDDVRILLAQILAQMEEITRRLPPPPAEQNNAPQPKRKKPQPGKGYPRL